MIICLERGADLHMDQLMPLPLIVSSFSKIQIGFTFLVLAHLSSPRQRERDIKRVCMCMCVWYLCMEVATVVLHTGLQRCECQGRSHVQFLCSVPV